MHRNLKQGSDSLAYVKANEYVIRHLTDEDRTALLAIYQHRCMDEELLYRYIYAQTDIHRAYCTDRVSQMISFRLLEVVDYAQPYPALFLTTLGVETVKAIYGDYLESLYRPGEARQLPISSDLKMHPKIINHQMHLNAFSMEFESYASEVSYFRYYDEKFMPPASAFMMPDAMVELANCYVLLEMDMHTENGGRLTKKWDSYRLFLNSPGFFYQEKPVVMLFIIDGVKNVELRKRNVAASFLSHLAERVNGQFEVYIDSSDALHRIIKSQLLLLETEETSGVMAVRRDIQKTQSFSISRPPFLRELDTPYGYYVRKLNEARRIQIVGGRPQEFLLDIWLDGRLSVFRNFLLYNRSLRKIRSLTRRDISYLIVVPSEKWANLILWIVNTPQPPGVFFTTPARLSACTWSEALFNIDQLGNLAHYTDASLSSLVHERRLAK